MVIFLGEICIRHYKDMASWSVECTRVYLEEETEADPLVVSDVSPLIRVDSLVNARMGHVHSNPLPEGAGDGVGGVDPAESVQHILQ